MRLGWIPMVVAAFLLVPASGAAQTQVGASFEVRGRRPQPELVRPASPGAPEGLPATAEFGARVPPGWTASVVRTASAVPARPDRRGPSHATETWTFVPL